MAEASVWAVVPAAGAGKRMGGYRAKQFLRLAGRPILSRTLAVLERVPAVAGTVVALPADSLDDARRECLEPFGFAKPVILVPGGKERQDSVAAGVAEAVERGADMLVIHDAVRPLATPELFGRVLAAANEHGAAAAGWPAVDTVKRADHKGRVLETLDRSELWLVQTPQAFQREVLLPALERGQAENFYATDECGLVERFGGEVRMVKGEAHNMKITRPEDLTLAEALVGGPRLRMGQGLDVHRLAQGRPLILGGVRLDFELGLAGHSDADVLTHAVMDALLAAAGLGDIGRLFPDTDPAYAGANSIALLARVTALLAEQGLRPAQVSVTLAAQRPKIAPHAAAMAANLAKAMGLAPEMVNVAATTSEGLGFTGRGEGMAAMASAVLESNLEQD